MTDTVWIPAVPLPLQGWRTDRCSCGERFRGKERRERYELHWRLFHEPDLPVDGPQCSMGVSRAEAEEIYQRVYTYGRNR